MGLLFTLMLAASIRQDHAPLRAGCAADAAVVAEVPVGTPVKLLYSMSGDAGQCYKVLVKIGGRMVAGYLAPAALQGLAEFDKGRRDAAWVEIKTGPLPGETPPAQAQEHTRPAPLRIAASKLVLQANDLVEKGRPEEALRLLEPEARKGGDSGLLTMAGIAAWKAEDSRLALEYWRRSLDLTPDPELQELYAQVERELKNDVSNDKLYGFRVMLRYDGIAVPADTAHSMVQAIDETYARMSFELGCTTQERIVTIVQTWDAYRKTTQAAEWSGGMFDGRIHMPTAVGQKMDTKIQKALAHETAHACLAMLGMWPTWLHEGMAQKLSGETMPASARAKVIDAAKAAKLTSLSKLDGGWAKLDSRNASLSYAVALAAVETLYEAFGADGVRNLMRSPERLPQMVTELDKRLGL